MPSNSSQKDKLADLDSTNLQFDRQDVSGDGASETDPPDARTSGKASAQIVGNRSVTTSSNLPSEEARNHSGDPSSSMSRNGRQSSQDGHLQIPSVGGAPRRQLETSIWDWDTPLESVSESSSYYYEPQGELLQEQQEQRLEKSEFSIPHAVQGSGVHWPFPASAVATGGNDGFAVPKRPSAIPPPIAGNKRKSISDRDGAGADKHSEQKRLSRMMSESGEDPTSPQEERPPAHSTCSQSGTDTRPRSAIDFAEAQARPAVTDIEAARPQGASSEPRRTLMDPSMPMVLPARKVFPIQIGDKLFRLSGASISSDGKPMHQGLIM